MASSRRRAPARQPLNASLIRSSDDQLVRSFVLALRSGWRREARAESTVRAYELGIGKLRAYLAAQGMPGLTDATREHVQEWVVSLRDGYAPASVRLWLAAVQQLYAWLVDEDERPDDPTAKIIGPKLGTRLRQPFARAELDRLLRTFDTKHWIGARDAALIAVLLDTGVRRGELAGMRMADVDWNHGTVIVTGKGDKQRLVPLGTRTRRLLDQYLRRRARAGYADHPALWVGRDGAPLAGTGVAALMWRLKGRTGIHVHPHRFRHSALQMLLDAGMDRESVRAISGHVRLEELAIYSRATDAKRAIAQHRRYSPMDRLHEKKKE